MIGFCLLFRSHFLDAYKVPSFAAYFHSFLKNLSTTYTIFFHSQKKTIYLGKKLRVFMINTFHVYRYLHREFKKSRHQKSDKSLRTCLPLFVCAYRY
jgi:hypothetical protein